jgi:hypothetical protein
MLALVFGRGGHGPFDSDLVHFVGDCEMLSVLGTTEKYSQRQAREALEQYANRLGVAR